jgi:uncharacterized repeat protein (TIGR03803 family)
MKQVLDLARKSNRANAACAIFIAGLTSSALLGQTFTTVLSFDYADGATPLGGLAQGLSGNLYGVTDYGGANGSGTIFKVTPGGTVTTLYSFCPQQSCPDGDKPSGLVQATNGNFYGTTYSGGAYGSGTVFTITPAGVLTTLYSFCANVLNDVCTDGNNPIGGVIQATNGDFYGTTLGGGAHDGGTVFKITPSGALTTLYSFCLLNLCADGAYPEAGLVQATNGNLYGTTSNGGANGPLGTVFEITPAGGLTTIYSFCKETNCADGDTPTAAMIQGSNGNLYGTTDWGGANANSQYCYVLYGGGCGTIFEITLGGALTTLYSFCSQAGCADGYDPNTPLVQATNGNLYGTTTDGGAAQEGEIFEITPAGALTVEYSFCTQGGGCPNGSYPYAGLVQDTNGELYGEAQDGGSGSVGTVFSFSVGLGPFIEARPGAGKVGAAVSILGTNLAGATTVTFNGTGATFNVISSSEIATTVPDGATSGKIKVVTPSRTLSSNAPFHVLP